MRIHPRYLISTVALLVWAWGLGLPTWAQTTRGTITGTVTDASGAVVPGAKITVTQIDTGYTYTTTTSNEANYVVPNLFPARYRVEAEMQGFEKTVIEPLQLHANETLAVNPVLKVGAVTQEIQVTSRGPLVQTATATISQVVDSQQVTDLPLNGRDFISLTFLTPGTNANLGGGDAGSNTVAISGSRPESNQFTLDGVNNGDIGFNAINAQISIDAISEVSTQRNTYSAESGLGIAQISVASKSGTNVFHGDVYEFLRNSALDARGFFDPVKFPFRQNQFGGSFGGPIIRDKTFVFFNYEGFRSIQSMEGPAAFWPTGTMMSGQFDHAITDPLTGQPFPGNQIPTTRFSPLTQRLLSSGLLPSTTTGTVQIPVSTPNDWDQWTLRIDHRLSAKDQIFGRITAYPSLSIFVLGIPFTGFTNEGLDYANAPINGTLQWTHDFSPQFLNELKFGYNRSHVEWDQTGARGKNLLQQANINANPLTFGPPQILMTGYTQFTSAISGPLIQGANNFEYRDNLTWVRGAHTLKFGGSFRDIQEPATATLFARGDYTFTGLVAGDPVADFLLGIPTISVGAGQAATVYNSWHLYNGFAQDDWKVAHRLTLNLGLRYDLLTTAQDRYRGRVPVFDPRAPGGAIVSGAANIEKAGLVNPDYTGIQPRIGFAWQPFGNSNTVVRGGVGRFKDLRPFNERAFNVGTLFNVQAAILTPWDDLWSATPPFPPLVLISDNPFAKDPYVDQWSFGIQRSLPSDSVLEVMYVGSRGHRLEERIDANQAMLPPLVNGVPDLTSPLGPRRPYPDFGSILQTTDIANSTYNALQVRFEKRYSHGLALIASYAYSKSLDTASSSCDSSQCNAVQNIRDLRAEYGPSSFDQTQHLVLSPIYILPFGKGQRYLSSLPSAANMLVSGWEASAIANFASGSPFTLAVVGGDREDVGAFGGGIQRANCLANPTLPKGQRTLAQYFNTSVAPAAPLGTYGTCSRDNLTGPGFNNWDIALLKNSAITERLKLQFRAEFFDAFNRPTFAAPNTDPTVPGYGAITSTNANAIPREIQFALKLLF